MFYAWPSLWRYKSLCFKATIQVINCKLYLLETCKRENTASNNFYTNFHLKGGLHGAYDKTGTQKNKR